MNQYSASNVGQNHSTHPYVTDCGLTMPNNYVPIQPNCLNIVPNMTGKVLINPNFMKKVYINPNFNKKVPSTIHINPNVKNKIHINPNVLKNINNHNTVIRNSLCDNKIMEISGNTNTVSYNSISDNITNILTTQPVQNSNIQNTNVNSKMDLSTRTKLIRVSDSKHVAKTNKEENTSEFKISNKDTSKHIPKRRNSLRSKYKIVRSGSKDCPSSTSKNKTSSCIEVKSKRRNSIKSKYKFVRSKEETSRVLKIRTPNLHCSYKNKFKVDNRMNKSKTNKPVDGKNNRKKYVYVNRFLSMSELAKSTVLKQTKPISKSGFVNINGIMYKKSANSIRRASISSKSTPRSSLNRTICKSNYKLIRKGPKLSSSNTKLALLKKDVKLIGKHKFVRIKKVSSGTILPSKMKKCNIPCPFYRKYGKCKGKEQGRCHRKHDPDQIVLCARFLQGACTDQKCLLSHKVSPEKMPTCKYYLEGSCSKEDCPYLHVKISPKADICREFLEGFCKKAAECDKRHQLLCPEFEKNGKCSKRQCPYPHGAVVRKYSIFNKFAKKFSNNKHKASKKLGIDVEKTNKISEVLVDMKIEKTTSNARYYVNHLENDIKLEIKSKLNELSDDNNEVSDTDTVLNLRPKLGELPSFIPFGEENNE